MVSEKIHQNQRNHTTEVLILVLVEDGLRECISKMDMSLGSWVLILVLVEDGLRVVMRAGGKKFMPLCLNPCSCGGWSQSHSKDAQGCSRNQS